jgi:hypothetical protein
LDSKGVGVVRARDITAQGIDAAWLAEYLRAVGGRGDRRLRNGGYVIFNRRITKPDFSGWKVYTGTSPHTAHIHVSFSRDQAGFDSTDGWGIAGVRVLRLTAPPMQGDDVREVQRVLKAWYRLPATFVDGVFGDETVRFVKRAQISTPPQPALEADGIVGELTRTKLGL